jgi:transcriptional regulator with XRE-family HTH domain
VAALLAYDDITQQQLADLMNLNQATISRKMAGRQGWTEKDLLVLAQVLADTRTRLMAALEWALRPLLTAP